MPGSSDLYKSKFFPVIEVAVSVFDCLVYSMSLELVVQLVPGNGEAWRAGVLILLIILFHYLVRSDGLAHETFYVLSYTI